MMICQGAIQLHAQSSYNVTVKAGPLRQSFAGFGASQASTLWNNIAATPRNTMADMVYHDLKMNVFRMWADHFDAKTVAQNLATFNANYVASGAIADIKSRGITTLLLAPEPGTGNGKSPPASLSTYAENLAEIILQIQNTYNVTINVTGICNEPGPWSNQNIIDCIKYLRSALDSRGLTSVKIIAPESSHPQGTDNIISAIHGDASAWGNLYGVASHSYSTVLPDDDIEQVKLGKPWWITESCNDAQHETTSEDENGGAVMAAHFLSDVNHGVTEWVYFIGLGQVSNLTNSTSASAYLMVYDLASSQIVTFLKYYYFKQMLNTFDAGSVFRECVSATEGGMYAIGSQNPAINAAAAYNPDGSWGISVVNDTGVTGDTSGSLFYPATTYNVTITVQELTNTPSMVFTNYRSRANNHFVNSGTLTLSNGVGTVSIAPRELVSLRSAATAAAVPAVPTGLYASTYNINGNAPVALIWNNTVKAVGWNVKRATVSGGPYTTIASITNTWYGDASALDGTPYYYVVSAVNAVGESSNSTEIVSSPTPLSWANVDVGTVGLAGSCTLSDSGVFTTFGAGTSLGTTADSFNYTCRTMTGDGTLIARLAVGASANTKVGIMMSETLGTSPKAACVYYNFNGVWLNAWMFYRSTAGSSGSFLTSSVTNVPTWLKLVRSGNTFTGYASADGTTWTMITSANISMAGTIYVGLVNESGSTTYMNKGIFDNVSAPCAAPTGLNGLINISGDNIALGWTACLGATSYNIKRATISGGPYTTIGMVTSPTLGYTDSTAVFGTNYYYVVSAVNSNGESASSTETIATPPPFFALPCDLTVNAIAANQIQLTWTNSLTNVYYTPSLTPPVVWTLLTNAPVFSSGRWKVALPIGTSGCGFFRLQQ